MRAVGYDKTITAELIVSAKGLPDVELARKSSIELDQVLAL